MMILASESACELTEAVSMTYLTFVQLILIVEIL